MRRLALALAFAPAIFAAPTNTGAQATVAEALKNRDTQTFQQLLKAKADVNAAEVDGTTALHWAAHWNDLAAVEALLKAGAKAQASNRYGVTPLAEACNVGNAEMIAKLIEAGADANAPQNQGQTPLMVAARVGNVDAIRTLLDHGAKVNTAEEWRGQTALMWAAGEGNAAATQLLISRGADVNIKSKVFDFRTLKAKVGSVPMNFPRGGFTALLFAARQGHLDVARQLVEGGADMNIADPDNTTPLLLAILNLHFDVAGYLIEKGANPSLADDRGRTPLYGAIEMHTMDVSNRPVAKLNDKLTSVDIARMLIAKKVDLNAPLKRVLAPRAVLDGADAAMGDGATPFVRAAHTGDVELMKMLLEAGANPRIATKAGITALMSAAGAGWRDGKTRGAEAEALEALKLCVELGLDVNAVSDRGETALHGAAARGANSIVQYLADHGANLAAKNKAGYTALDAALGKGAAQVRAPNEATAELLRKLEAEQNRTASN
jgi:ankyrin repeat protein